jgi:hypothetical protein
MTDKDVPEPDALELVVRARRNALTAAERNTFDQALATSASVRTAYEVGSDLDLATRVQPGDEALLDRALARALGAHRGGRTRFVEPSSAWGRALCGAPLGGGDA